MNELLWALGKIGFMLALILGLLPAMIWAERKGAAYMQDRIGPNRASIGGVFRLAGLVHPIADVLKLVFKIALIPVWLSLTVLKGLAIAAVSLLAFLVVAPIVLTLGLIVLVPLALLGAIRIVQRIGFSQPPCGLQQSARVRCGLAFAQTLLNVFYGVAGPNLLVKHSIQ